MCTINPKSPEQQRNDDEVKRLFPNGGQLSYSPGVLEMYEMFDERDAHDALSGYHRTTW